MSNILGSLLLELGINTSAFSSGLDKATYQAKQFGKELKESMQQAQGAIAGLVGSLGDLGGPAVSGALQGVLSGLESIGKAGGPIGAVFALVAAEIAVIGGAVIGFTLKAAEAAEKINSLSESTGVAVGTLSVLGQVAAINGISLEQLAKGLEKMDKSAVAASEGGSRAKTAYQQLGIAVTDNNGKLKNSETIFRNVADRFAELEDGPKKTELAIKIFGKAGADLIPILNRGGQAISEYAEHVKKLGAVLDDNVAAASVKLEENLELIKAAFTGLQYKLLQDFLPAITEVTNELVAAFEDHQSELNTFIDGMVLVAKVVLNVFQGVAEVLKLYILAFRTAATEVIQFGNTVTNVFDALKSGSPKLAIEELKSSFHQMADTAKNSFLEAYDSIAGTVKNIGKVWDENPVAPKSKHKKDLGTGGTTNVDFVNEAIRAMEREAQKAEDAAKAIGTLSQATIEANAAAEANAAIQKLQDEAWKKGIENTTAFKAALDAAIPKIKEAALWQQTFKAATVIQNEFDKFNDKIEEQISALQGEAQAGNAVERQWAKNDATLVPLSKHLESLTAEYIKQIGAEKVNSERVKELGEEINKLTDELAAAYDETQKWDKAFQEMKVREEMNKLDEEALKIDETLDNIAHGDTFLNVASQVGILRKQLSLTDDQVKDLIPKLSALRSKQIQEDLAKKQAGLGFDDNKINTIQAEMDALNASGQSGEKFTRTMAELNKEMADLQAKTGGLGAGFKAAFADMATQAKSSGEIIQETVGKAFAGIADNFAQMVTTGKAHWQDLITSMEQMLIKSAINSLLAKLAGALGGATGGGTSGGGLSGILGSILGGLGHRAMGGDVSPGKSYIVGENGPEVFQPDYSGVIIPNGMSSGSAGHPINQNIYVSSPNADSFVRSRAQIEAEMYRAAANSHARMR